jgi:hypothetical protein
MLSQPLANLHAVPDGVSDAAAVFTEPHEKHSRVRAIPNR